jgi:hypothetical protein
MKDAPVPQGVKVIISGKILLVGLGYLVRVKSGSS